MTSHAINLQDSSWVPPLEIPRRDFFLEFMLIVVLPLVLGLVLFIILSLLMFGRRTGLDKRNQTTPEPQMVQFDTIRRATTNLRYMSSRRDGPPPLSPRPLATSNPSFPQPGCSNEEARGHSLPPPPYRLPPQYHSEEAFQADTLQPPEPPRRSSSRTGSVNDTATLPMRSA